jgi:N-acetyl sugar amidotransferase
MALPAVPYQVCTRCVMDTSDPDITFDANGVCSHCHAVARRAVEELLPPEVAQQALDRVVAEMKRAGQGRKYDCIIGVSGGVDSTMVALHVKRLGLRPLAVHFDNGWNAELAVKNIEVCLKTLDIDLLTHVVDWEEFRDLQLALIKASVPNIEIVTDHAIMALLFRTAAREGVPYIVSGGNVATESVMPRHWTYDSRDLRHILGIHKRFGTVPVRTLPRCTLAEYAYYLFLRRIKYIPLLNYVSYNKDEAKQTIKDVLGWKDYGGKHYESIFTRFFQSYILPRKFNMDKRRPHYSSLILSGQLTRTQALADLAKPACAPDLAARDLEFFLKKMRLSEAEFAAIMSSPVKNFRDYPSNAWLFAQYGSWPFRLVKRIVRPRSLKPDVLRA